MRVQLMTIHVACKNIASVVKWKLMPCKVECKCGRRGVGWGGIKSSLKKPMKVACVDRTGSVFGIPSRPCCLRRNRRPRSGRAGRG